MGGRSVHRPLHPGGYKYLTEDGSLLNVDGPDYISFRGWANPTVGGIEIDRFGYKIGTNEPVFSADFRKDEPELNAALNSPAAKRCENIKIPVADLANGTYDVYLLVKDTAGVIYCMNGSWASSLMLVKTDAVEPEPEAPAVETYNVPMDTRTVSGHAAGITNKDKPNHGGMVAAGGLENGALLHQALSVSVRLICPSTPRSSSSSALTTPRPPSTVTPLTPRTASCCPRLTTT